jgi:hypothetical protein
MTKESIEYNTRLSVPDKALEGTYRALAAIFVGGAVALVIAERGRL